MSGSRIINGWMKSMYRPKDCEYSVTDITMPSAQLWAKANSDFEENTEKVVGFKSFLGSALHKAIEETDEDGVIKELSWVRTLADGTRIGGTTDELRWRYSINKWRLGDVKLKGDYPTKKFLGIGTKANPNPKPEQEKEQLQMSIYRWLFEGMFDIEDKAVIYMIIPGHNTYDPLPEYQEVWIDLLPIKTMDSYIKGKLALAESDTPPDCDCNKAWMCRYCPFQDTCLESTERVKEENDHSEFKDEK
jgi:CRISPR/Cas system-associated exonuclease Cas4 (RecB family)